MKQSSETNTNKEQDGYNSFKAKSFKQSYTKEERLRLLKLFDLLIQIDKSIKGNQND
ncbi:MAG: hypothetical protein WAX66_04570 [Patescibacteria group bacterium]